MLLLLEEVQSVVEVGPSLKQPVIRQIQVVLEGVQEKEGQVEAEVAAAACQVAAAAEVAQTALAADQVVAAVVAAFAAILLAYLPALGRQVDPDPVG